MSDSEEEEFTTNPMFKSRSKPSLTVINGIDMESMITYSYTIDDIDEGSDHNLLFIWDSIFDYYACDPDGFPDYPDDRDIWKRYIFQDELIRVAMRRKSVNC